MNKPNDSYCSLVIFASPSKSLREADNTHRQRRRDSTQQLSRVGGVLDIRSCSNVYRLGVPKGATSWTIRTHQKSLDRMHLGLGPQRAGIPPIGPGVRTPGRPRGDEPPESPARLWSRRRRVLAERRGWHKMDDTDCIVDRYVPLSGGEIVPRTVHLC